MVEQQEQVVLFERQELRGTGVAVSAWIAGLFWWIGLSGYIAVGGFSGGAASFGFFLVLPLLATGLTYVLARRRLLLDRQARGARHRRY